LRLLDQQPLALQGIEQLVHKERVTTTAARNRITQPHQGPGFTLQPAAEQTVHLLAGEVGQREMERGHRVCIGAFQELGHATARYRSRGPEQTQQHQPMQLRIIHQASDPLQGE
jgi:hypothetical protein